MTAKQLEDLHDANDDAKAEFCRIYMPLCQSESEFHAALEEAIKNAKEVERNPSYPVGVSPHE